MPENPEPADESVASTRSTPSAPPAALPAETAASEGSEPVVPVEPVVTADVPAAAGGGEPGPAVSPAAAVDAVASGPVDGADVASTPDDVASTPDDAVDVASTPAAAPAVPHLSPAECAAQLAARFPALFARPQPLPLKLRIQQDVQQRAPGVFSRKALSIFLQRHTTGTAYLKALVHGGERFDLDGQPAGTVADEHREAAKAELSRRRALHDERRAAERAAQRQSQESARQAWLADQQARQSRAALLRAFETTTLTRANFCALKQLPETELDALLARARAERASQPPAPPDGRPAGRPPRDDQRASGRPPRDDPRPPGRPPRDDQRPAGRPPRDDRRAAPSDRKGPPRRPGPRPPSPR